MSNFSIATTEDGSLSLHENNLNELYHNRAGAFTEAVTNYVEPAMQFLQLARAGGSLKVLDSCFGLGYNSLALASYLAARSAERSCSFKLRVEGIEIDPDVLAVVPEVLAQPCFSVLENQTLEHLNFKISVCDLRQFLLNRETSACPHDLYDLIFHDPFSPKKVPELWSVDLFQHYHRAMAEDSALLTYACAPAVRGALLSLGFKVFRTTGLGRKNGGTIAIKTSNPALVQALLKVDSSCIFEIVGEELRRLGKSSQVPFRDANLNDDRRTILIRREAEQQEFRRNDAANG